MSFALSALSVVRGNGHCHSMLEPVSGSDRVGCTIFKSQRNRICRRQFSRHWTRSLPLLGVDVERFRFGFVVSFDSSRLRH